MELYAPEQVKAICLRGGYILKDSGGKPDIIQSLPVVGNGSTLGGGKIDWRGHNVRVVSLPSTDVTQIICAGRGMYRESGTTGA
ncbi:hypothetical protein KCP78_12075 [Salmonella enterica subsp. enterica]|nr:hypothetical protein KCP78_12075 [Salmonella enterica subsp. enterica]